VDGEALNIKNPTNAVVVICHVIPFWGALGLCPKPRQRTFLQKGSLETPKTFEKGIYRREKNSKKEKMHNRGENHEQFIKTD
jgi:hypothetical protein